MQENQEVIATLRASQPRRVLGVGAAIGLGLVLIYTAAFKDNGVLQAGLVIGGIAALWCAQLAWRGTANTVELTAEGLRDADGTMIALIADIVAVDRGMFAFKPSNGFLVRLRASGPSVVRLGLWWRIGRRVGVGGMTPAPRSKLMAERLAMLVQENGPQE